MSFASLPFVGLVAAGVILYYLVPKRAQWLLLLAVSMAFYLAGGAKRAVWLVLAAGLTWLAGLLLEKQNARPAPDKTAKTAVRRVKKRICAACLVLCFGLLYLMKYWNFTASALPSAIGDKLPRWDFVVPLGLSYFIFQAAGYVIDVYRGKYPAQKNPLKYGLFVSFFPQMVQGPISRYDQLAPQLLSARGLDWRDLKFGIQLCLWGYFKKLVIADRAAVLVNAVITENCPYGGAVVACGILFYCIQLYCDFSGGIDITRGVARMFGIDMAENFRRPIFATSLTDYWRRWHITLGAWMRDYVFYPLSLSRGFGKISRWARAHIRGTGGKIFATSLATFIVYLIIGVWHGANFRYIAFGLWNGVLITASLLLEKTFLRWKAALHIDDKSAAWRAFMTLRTGLLVFVGRYFTRAPRLRSVFTLFKTTVLHPQPSQLLDGTLLSLGLAKTDFLVVALALAVLLTLECFQERGVHIRPALEKKPGFVQWLAVTALLLAVLLLGVFRAGYIPSGFIYTQF